MKKIIFIGIILLIGGTTRAQYLLSLDSCRSLAIENNKQLKIASENLKKASYEKKSAFAQYLPDISFLGAYMYNQKNLSLLDADKFLPIGTKMPDGSFGFTPDQIAGTTLPNGQWVPVDAGGVPFDPKQNPEKIVWKEYTTIPKSEFEMDVHNVWAGVFSVVQPVFMGGKIVAYNQITKFAEQLASSQKNTELQSIILKTDEIYWQIVSLSSKKKLTDSYVDLLKKMDSNVQELIEEGFATKADGLSVKVKLNEAEMAQVQVADGLNLSKMLLAQLCGLPIDGEINLADENAETLSVPDVSTAVDINLAMMNRPELQSLDLVTKIYEKKETITRSEMLPSLALTANYMVTNPNLFNGFHNEFAGMWNVGIVLRVPIFHWGDKYQKLNVAKAETRIKKLELEEAKEKIELQVNQSMFKLNEARKNMVLADKNMENADENLRYANAGFEEGVIPLFNVMEAQTAWLKAHSQLIDAQIDSKLAEVYLRKSIGALNR